MGDFLLKIIFGKIAASLDGYKMYILGTGFILKGLLELIGHYWPDTGFTGADLNMATDHIMYGLGLYAGKSAIAKTAPLPQ